MSNDGGKSWKFQDGAIKTGWFFRDIAFSSPTHGIAVGASDTIVLTDDGGKTWDFKAGIYYTVKDLQESVRYWRQFVPDDGMRLNELL